MVLTLHSKGGKLSNPKNHSALMTVAIMDWASAVTLSGGRVLELAKSLYERSMTEDMNVAQSATEFTNHLGLVQKLHTESYFFTLALNNFCDAIEHAGKISKSFPQPPFNREAVKILRNIKEHWLPHLGKLFVDDITNPTAKKSLISFFKLIPSSPVTPHAIHMSLGSSVIIAQTIDVAATIKHAEDVVGILNSTS